MIPYQEMDPADRMLCVCLIYAHSELAAQEQELQVRGDELPIAARAQLQTMQKAFERIGKSNLTAMTADATRMLIENPDIAQRAYVPAIGIQIAVQIAHNVINTGELPELDDLKKIAARILSLGYITSGELQSDIKRILANQQQEKITMAEDQQQLDAALAAEQQETATLAQDVQSSAAIAKQLAADFAALLAKIPAGSADFTSEVNSINANLTLLQSTDTTAQSNTATDTSTDQSVDQESATLGTSPPPATGS